MGSNVRVTGLTHIYDLTGTHETQETVLPVKDVGVKESNIKSPCFYNISRRWVSVSNKIIYVGCSELLNEMRDYCSDFYSVRDNRLNSEV